MNDHRLLPNATGFAGPTTLLTSWGACRLHDLARLSNRRDQAVGVFAQQTANMEQVHSQKLELFDESTAQNVRLAPEVHKEKLAETHAAARKAMADEQAEALALFQATRKADIAGQLPEMRLGAGESVVQFESVGAEPEMVFDVVDVVIARADVPGTDDNKQVDIVVRCTPDWLFVTLDGDMPAAALEGQQITRVHADGSTSWFVVPYVTPVVLNSPIPVYRVRCDAETCCVGADGTIAAIVRANA